MQRSHRFARPYAADRSSTAWSFDDDSSTDRSARRRSVLVCGAVLTVLAAFAAAEYTPGGAGQPVGFEAAAPASVPMGRVVPAAPAFISRNGVDYKLQQVPVAALMRTATDAQRLQMYVLQPPQSSSAGCNQLAVSVRVVRQTADAVTVAAFGYRSAATTSSKNVTCSDGTEGTQTTYRQFDVTLAQPIGHRKVIDEKTGQVAGMLDDSLVSKPGYLPAGFRLTVDHGFTASTGFVGLLQYTNGATAIEIRTRSATVWPPAGQVVATATVNGYFAKISNQPFERCVTWEDRPGLVREVCSLGSNRTFLPADQLLLIANSLH